MNIVVVGGSNGAHLAEKIASIGGYHYSKVIIDRFPDGELYVRIPIDVSGKIVVYVNSLQKSPNESLIETFLTIDALRDLGAVKLIAVIPYISYARQDYRFKPGEAISIQTIAKLFRAINVDHMVTVDMHLHRISDPSALFGARFVNITGVRDLAKYYYTNYRESVRNTVVVGPDEEAEQWARIAAEELGGVEYGVMYKTRISANKVIVEARGVNVKGKNVLLVDDIISTGGTIVEAVKALREQGASEVFVGVVHAILVGNALDKLLSLGLRDLYATDTIMSPISKVSVAQTIQKHLEEIIGKMI
ncbi:MAG: ribose-phosphate diphosphokinase [Desulfurococcaceae archaeon]